MVSHFSIKAQFHEEIAQRKGVEHFPLQDATSLLTEAKNWGANVVRLAHYPQNEYIIRQAEKWVFYF